MKSKVNAFAKTISVIYSALGQIDVKIGIDSAMGTANKRYLTSQHSLVLLLKRAQSFDA